MRSLLSLFWTKLTRPPEVAFTPPKITFVGEQDGPIERELKHKFAAIFLDETVVQRAYLAKADYGDGTGIHVVLCVRSSVGEDPTLNAKTGAVFSKMFGSHEHLDFLFIGEDQDQQLSQVCLAFYDAG